MSAPTTRFASDAGGRFAGHVKTLVETLSDDAFLPLPVPRTAEGRERRTGVEIEFGGMDEVRAAQLVVACLGGRSVASGKYAVRVEDTVIGAVRIELDTAFRGDAPSRLKAVVLDLSRRVVPVEIVTDPVAPRDLRRIEELRATLCAAGAIGSRGGRFLGFGLHLNVEVAARTAAAVVPVLRAFALLEDWLRRQPALDPSRRLLPFVDPYPRRFVDRVAAEGADWDLDRLAEVYLDESPSRNRGLDLLPLLRDLDAARVERALGAGAASVSARPAFHYRLPDSRVDEADWRIAHEWNRWRLVEAVAADEALLSGLAEEWVRHRSRVAGTVADWRRHVENVLAEVPAGLVPP
jgi:hypothetical protein